MIPYRRQVKAMEAHRPSVDTVQDTGAQLPKSALGVLTEIIATVESYGTGGVWLSGTNPLIAKARLACFEDRASTVRLTTANGPAAVLRGYLQDLIERIDAAHALLALYGAEADPAPQTVARLNALRDLLDTGGIVRGLDPARRNAAEISQEGQEPEQ